MEIKDFEVEQWMNLWETKCTYNVAETVSYTHLYGHADGVYRRLGEAPGQ